MTARLSLRGVTRRFGPVAALDGVTLHVAPGEFLALLGGSGSGKSTLLRVIAGFEAPDSGTVQLDGADLFGVPPHRRPVNMMFQSYALFPHMSVAANIAYGLKREGLPRAEITARVAQAIAMLRLEGMETRKPHALSGGQRQRVALARALVKRPRLLLLDEPLGALDANLRERTGFELRAIQRESGAAFVMVTHDQAEALALADRVAVMDRGRIVQAGPPREVYDRPSTRFIATFLGAANVLEGTRTEDGALDCPGAGCTLRAEAPLPEEAAAVALRPERIRLAPEPGENTAVGTVEESAFRGDSSLLLVRMQGGATLRVSHAEEDGAPPPRGATVRLAWDRDDVVPLLP
ncbi:ABC transporter ATP-binding protein [Pararoseomonas indoligenes]|uniref:Spermidine/putrescine import ATP-binding protein PotA n=1 Tax=Roseomonas indoligenes TaxID=2820811 RepID=A0A940MQX5_9PROT|nr:ABC transporter ATP-binding protein [Pararoseomonas indoligenes]MBP0491839.1 ABC transporter ATP-binding protein [Pararoseomonas indoligenes]